MSNDKKDTPIIADVAKACLDKVAKPGTNPCIWDASSSQHCSMQPKCLAAQTALMLMLEVVRGNVKVPATVDVNNDQAMLDFVYLAVKGAQR